VEVAGLRATPPFGREMTRGLFRMAPRGRAQTLSLAHTRKVQGVMQMRQTRQTQTKCRRLQWWVYESTPQPQGINTEKRTSRDLGFPRFEKCWRIEKLFPQANLIQRLA